MVTLPPPFDVTIAVALLPYVVLALLALASPILALVAVRRRRARHAATVLACHGSAAPGGCFNAREGGTDCGAACALNDLADLPRWTEEDRLTYALQAEGPDEMPEGYYRSLARTQLADDHRTAAAEGDAFGRPCSFRQPDGGCDLSLRCACRTPVANLLDYDDETPEPHPGSLRILTADEEHPPGVRIGNDGITVRVRAHTLDGDAVTGTATITPVGDVSGAETAAVLASIDGALVGNTATTTALSPAAVHSAAALIAARIAPADTAADAPSAFHYAATTTLGAPIDPGPFHDQTVRYPVSDAPSYASDRTTLTVPPYLRDPEPAPARDADGYAVRAWPENVLPTAGEWAAWFVACSPVAQREIAEKVLADNATAHDCFLRNHAGMTERWNEARREVATMRAQLDDYTIRGHATSLDLFADYDALRERAEAAEHDLTQTRGTLDRARESHRRVFDALRACEAAYAAAQDEWKAKERDLRYLLGQAEDTARMHEESGYNGTLAVMEDLDAERARADAAEARAERILANVAADGASDRLIACARADEHVLAYLAANDTTGGWKDLDTPFERVAYLTDTLDRLTALAQIDTVRLEHAARDRERANAFRDRYNECAVAHNVLLAENRQLRGLRDDEATYPYDTEDVPGSGYDPEHRAYWTVTNGMCSVNLTAAEVRRAYASLTGGEQTPDRATVRASLGLPTVEEANAILDAREADEDAHRAAQIAVADARTAAEADDLSWSIAWGDSALHPSPEPIGTAAEWEARLEEWHAAEQREAATLPTVETSRGLTYPSPMESDTITDWGETWSRTVTTAHTPAYVAHDTIAETAASV